MNILLASTPIILILILMVGLRWSASRAGSAGYLVSLPIAILAFGAGPELIAYAHTKALMLTLDVLLIIWAAFLLYRVADEAGAIELIGKALPELTPDKGLQAILIGWVFASFLQGVGGFGVPVAVIAPILVSLGFSPLSAVVIPSLGHGWAVTFGSMGSSFQALIAATDLPAEILVRPSALFLGFSAIMVGWMVTHAAGGWKDLRRLFLISTTIGIAMAATQYFVAAAGPWNIAAFAGGIVGLCVGIPIAYWKRNHNHPPQINWKALLVALSGYALLITLTLLIQLVAPVKAYLNQVVIQIQFPETTTLLGFATPAAASRKLSIFGHTGSILLYASILGYLVYRKAGLYPQNSVKRILVGTLQRVMSSSVSIASMIMMAVVMEHAGMTDALARSLASSVGSAFPWISPWIGALGAFMTGSNTNSNVVFGALQLTTAQLLNYSAPAILAAQTAGAGLASVMAPAKVVVGASTAGMAGKEGEIMRALISYTIIMVLFIGALAALSV
jgi:lactate permease